MLLIYSSLPVGGIETFFCRLAKERFNNQLKTSIFFLSEELESNQELMLEMKKYADVYFYSDVFRWPNIFNKIKILRTVFTLVMPIKLMMLAVILKNATQVHVTNGVHALLAKRIIDLLNIKVPITVGVYHSQEFAWGGKLLPYFERVNRRFVLDALSGKNFFCFSESTIQFIRKKTGFPIADVKKIRFGVVSNEKNIMPASHKTTNEIKVCMVGRLVDFKKYNLTMIDVVNDLNVMGFNVILHIYGDGPMLNQIKAKITENEMRGKVSLMGELNYSDFDETVASYDLFLGSGSSIIQAASLGVPSIIGIESNPDPTSYGFFSEFYDDEYHHPDLGYEKVEIKKLIVSYITAKKEEKDKISRQHINAANLFSMRVCSESFEADLSNNIKLFKYSIILYILSSSIFSIYLRLFGKTIYARSV